VKSRLTVLLTVAALWCGAISWRLWDLQVQRHGEYRERASRQQQRVVELDPPRGAILDARGRELAVSVEVESAFAVPREIESPEAASAALAGALRLDRAKLLRQLRADREFVWVARKLDPPQAQAVRALRLPASTSSREQAVLPAARARRPGCSATSAPTNRGLAGLEAVFQQEIGGQPGKRTVLRDARRGTVLDRIYRFTMRCPAETCT
jgi:cell division protein FtsI (penicillin-binding protein 3)